MEFAVLYSGGKDSNLALWLAQKEGLDIAYLITISPHRDDSYMFHKPNLMHVPMLAESLDIPLILEESGGVKEEELKDLENALDSVDVDGVITGAVASRYQSDRIEKIAEDRGMEVVSPLWGIKQVELMETLLKEGFKCIIVGVAAMGLNERWLGRKIDQRCFDELMDLHQSYSINVAGEGGEYESFILDAPNFKWKFSVESACKNWDGHRGTYDIESIKRCKKS
ncbi:MAG: diphthine--ammonia ligase [Thermoplasmata archaeon]